MITIQPKPKDAPKQQTFDWEYVCTHAGLYKHISSNYATCRFYSSGSGSSGVFGFENTGFVPVVNLWGGEDDRYVLADDQVVISN